MLSFQVIPCLLISNMAASGHFEFPAVAEIAHAGPSAIFFGESVGHLGCISEKIGSSLKISWSWSYIAYAYRTTGLVVSETEHNHLCLLLQWHLAILSKLLCIHFQVNNLLLTFNFIL